MRLGVLAPYALLAAIVVLIFWDPVARASFGCLDDADTILICRDLQERSPLEWITRPTEHWPDRFFPLFWMQHLFVLEVFGANPRPFFVALGLIFLATTWLVAWTARRLQGGSAWAALVGGLCFLLGGATAECATSLSKQEPLLALFCALYLACVVQAEMLAREDRPGALPWTLLALLAAFLALMSKETAVALGAVSGVLAMGLWMRRMRGRAVLHAAIVAMLAGGYVFGRVVLSRQGDVSAVAPSYQLAFVAQTLTVHIEEVFPFVIWMVPAAVLLFVRSRRDGEVLWSALLAGCAVFYALYLPWTLPQIRYLLPVFAVWSVTAGLLVPRRRPWLVALTVPLLLASWWNGAWRLRSEIPFRVGEQNAFQELIADIDHDAQRRGAERHEPREFLAREAARRGPGLPANSPRTLLAVPAWYEPVLQIRNWIRFDRARAVDLGSTFEGSGLDMADPGTWPAETTIYVFVSRGARARRSFFSSKLADWDLKTLHTISVASVMQRAGVVVRVEEFRETPAGLFGTWIPPLEESPGWLTDPTRIRTELVQGFVRLALEPGPRYGLEPGERPAWWPRLGAGLLEPEWQEDAAGLFLPGGWGDLEWIIPRAVRVDAREVSFVMEVVRASSSEGGLSVLDAGGKPLTWTALPAGETGIISSEGLSSRALAQRLDGGTGKIVVSAGKGTRFRFVGFEVR